MERLRQEHTNMILLFSVRTGYKFSKEKNTEQVRIQMLSLVKAAKDIEVRCTKGTKREHIFTFGHFLQDSHEVALWS